MYITTALFAYVNLHFKAIPEEDCTCDSCFLPKLIRLSYSVLRPSVIQNTSSSSF